LITKEAIQFDPILGDYVGAIEKEVQSVDDVLLVCKIIETERTTRGTDMN